MKIEFDFANENDRKVAEELFDRFSTDYNPYYVVPSSGGSSPITGSRNSKLMEKQMFLYALQSMNSIK
jgi:hypothetical protein